jgi:MFS transporter
MPASNDGAGCPPVAVNGRAGGQGQEPCRADGVIGSAETFARRGCSDCVSCGPIASCSGHRHAGLLFAFAALGMLIGDTLTGRFVPARWRERISAPLRMLLAAPYLVFAIQPALPIAVAAVVLASIGYSASLLLQHRLMALTPDELSGHALGLHFAGMLAMQGVGAAIAGAVAGRTSPGTAMAVMAVISIAVTVALAPGLRPDRPPGPDAPSDLRARPPVSRSALRGRGEAVQPK